MMNTEGALVLADATRHVFRPSRATDAVKVVVSLRPPRDGSPVVVEEVIPPSWNVANISNDGARIPGSRAIRWGPLSASSSGSLEYTVTPSTVRPVPSRITGSVSWSGRKTAVLGGDLLTLGPDGGFPSPIRYLPDGSIVLQMLATADGHQVVEVSQDLVQWTPLVVVKPEDGMVEVLENDTSRQGMRFYRISPVP
jgi:hypothetical protein